VREHPLVAAALLGVASRSAEDLDEELRHVRQVVLADLPCKHRAEQLIDLDTVVEGVEQPSQGARPTKK